MTSGGFKMFPISYMSEPHTDSKEEEEQLFVQGRLEFDASDAKFSFYNVRINFCVDCNW